MIPFPSDCAEYEEYVSVMEAMADESDRLPDPEPPAKKFVIESPSAYRSHNCLLGEGDSPALAWVDAYGPKPWSPYTRKCARNAWVREVTLDELHDLHCQS